MQVDCFLHFFSIACFEKRKLAGVILSNAHKEIKRAKSESLFAHLVFFLFLIINRMLGFELDFEFRSGLTLRFKLDY